MKLIKYIIFIFILILGIQLLNSSHSRQVALNASPEFASNIKFSNNEFKEKYIDWCNAISRPETSIMSSNVAYQDIPEYQAMIDVGEPALKDLQTIIESKTGMYHMLYLSIIKIKKWDIDGFQYHSNQEACRQVLERLKQESKR